MNQSASSSVRHRPSSSPTPCPTACPDATASPNTCPAYPTARPTRACSTASNEQEPNSASSSSSVDTPTPLATPVVLRPSFSRLLTHHSVHSVQHTHRPQPQQQHNKLRPFSMVEDGMESDLVTDGLHTATTDGDLMTEDEDDGGWGLGHEHAETHEGCMPDTPKHTSDGTKRSDLGHQRVFGSGRETREEGKDKTSEGVLHRDEKDRAGGATMLGVALRKQSPNVAGIQRSQRITIFITPAPSRRLLSVVDDQPPQQQQQSQSSQSSLSPSAATANTSSSFWLHQLRLSPVSESTLQTCPKYHLTKYFLRQMLVICRIKPADADHAATKVKEFLVNSGLYQITQWQLECILFHILADPLVFPNPSRSISPNLFRVVHKFQASRGALVIVVTGTPCFGRPIVPLKLAERLNVPNVVRTQVVVNVLSFPHRSPRIPEGDTEEEILANFKSMCCTVHKGLSGDLEKARANGKSVLVEGLLIDPQLYLDLFVPIDETHRESPSASTDTLTAPAPAPLPSLLQSSSSSSSPKSSLVVFVPFLLVGDIDCRQVCRSQGQGSTLTDIERPMRALRVIDNYMRQYSQRLNVIHVESHEVSEAKLDEMHRITLQYLQRSFAAS